MALSNIRHSSNQDEHEDLAEINIIPLVDIMLVLLIIFMVAAPLSISGIGVQLPHSKAKGGKIDQDRIVLSIDSNGHYYFNKSRVEERNLPEKLKAIFAIKDRKELYIIADRRVIYEQVIFAMSAAKLAGVNKMSMLTTPPKS